MIDNPWKHTARASHKHNTSCFETTAQFCAEAKGRQMKIYIKQAKKKRKLLAESRIYVEK